MGMSMNHYLPEGKHTCGEYNLQPVLLVVAGQKTNKNFLTVVPDWSALNLIAALENSIEVESPIITDFHVCFSNLDDHEVFLILL